MTTLTYDSQFPSRDHDQPMSAATSRPSLGRFLYSSLGACFVGFVVLGILTIACALYAQAIVKFEPPASGEITAPSASHP